MYKQAIIAVTVVNALAITVDLASPEDPSYTTENKGDTCWLKGEGRDATEIPATCPDGWEN